MKSRFVMMIAGLSLGLFSACGPVEPESEPVDVGQVEAGVDRYLCGDGFCDTLNGENSDNCSWDCGHVLTWCGDGVCNGLETRRTCPEDCGLILTYCGDGLCNGNETANTCPQDCGVLTWCGDGVCNGSETTATCSMIAAPPAATASATAWRRPGAAVRTAASSSPIAATASAARARTC